MYRRKIFRAVLRHALEVRFGSKRITASQFANAYNLITDDSITTETARKWISGPGIPRYVLWRSVWHSLYDGITDPRPQTDLKVF